MQSNSLTSAPQSNSVSVQPRSVIYFAPVKPEFFTKWEYYRCDLEMLERTYDNVCICHTFLDVFRCIFRKNDVFCWWWHLSFPVIALSRMLGRKVFCTGAIHMFDCSGAKDFYSKSFIYRLLIKWSLHLSNVNLFISNDQEISVVSHLHTNNPVTIYSSLLPDKANLIMEHVIDQHKNTRPSELKFLFLCWLTTEQLRRKGFFVLLDAFSQFVHQSDPTAKLIVAGKTGDGLGLICSAVDRLGVGSNVEFRLDLPDAEKSSLYCEADLFISPSSMEGFGNASLESMSYGLPAVVTRYGASHEVVGETGFIINNIDVDSIYSVLQRYANFDPEKRLGLREAAFRRAHDFFGFDTRLTKFKTLVSSAESVGRLTTAQAVRVLTR